jgi:hypothetical protein
MRYWMNTFIVMPVQFRQLPAPQPEWKSQWMRNTVPLGPTKVCEFGVKVRSTLLHVPLPLPSSMCTVWPLKLKSTVVPDVTVKAAGE